jgi:hypothetical protein
MTEYCEMIGVLLRTAAVDVCPTDEFFSPPSIVVDTSTLLASVNRLDLRWRSLVPGLLYLRGIGRGGNHADGSAAAVIS